MDGWLRAQSPARLAHRKQRRLPSRMAAAPTSKLSIALANLTTDCPLKVAVDRGWAKWHLAHAHCGHKSHKAQSTLYQPQCKVPGSPLHCSLP